MRGRGVCLGGVLVLSVWAWVGTALGQSAGTHAVGAPSENDPDTAGLGGERARPVVPTDPLIAAIHRQARDGYARIRSEIGDYTCTVVKRERVGGRLGTYEFLSAKVRHARGSAPFSVYLKFHAPEDLHGREVLYVDGQNEGRLIARNGGLRFAYITTEVEPTSDVAMEGNRYPITEFGIENLLKRFVEHLDNAVLDGCTIETLEGSKVDGRACTCFQITNHERFPREVGSHPPTSDRVASFRLSEREQAAGPPPTSRSSRPRFRVARVFIDPRIGFPVHYEAFDWPKAAGDPPRLLEQYTYRDIRWNVGLTDRDFDRTNPSYGFRKPSAESPR
ncbi:MAG: DUF1571 domain-containing protein [Planctomycetes bacterium]|nr:DUF1571 domain-containing protein [Planctomycetota bacterium]